MWDLTVPEDPKEMAKIITDMRNLIKDVLIPELLNQKEEIRNLREITWPVCQSIRECSQLTDIENKKKFLQDFDEHEAIHLLKMKNKISSEVKFKPSSSNLLREEISRLGLKK